MKKETLLFLFHLPRFPFSKPEVNIPLENLQVWVLVGNLQLVIGENDCAHKFYFTVGTGASVPFLLEYTLFLFIFCKS